MRPDDEPAFPQPVTVGPNDDLYPAYPGMTLRDYFAGQVIGHIATDESVEVPAGRNPSTHISRMAYLIADAMLEARK